MTIKELKAMSNEELVGYFDYICTKLTHEVGTMMEQTKKTTADWEQTKKTTADWEQTKKTTADWEQTKKTTADWEQTKAELLRRLNG